MLYVWSYSCFSKKYEIISAKIICHSFIFILSFGLVPLFILLSRLFVSNDPETDRKLLNGTKVERDEEFAIETLKSDLIKFGGNPFKKHIKEGMELFLGIKIPEYFEVLNFLIAGGMGSGKTSAFFMPIAKQVFDRGDFIILPDVKGDFSQVFSGEKGVMIFSPIDERSFIWAIGKDIKTRVDAEEFSATLIQSSNDDNFFTLAARDILSGILQALQAEKKEDWNFKDIIEVSSSLPTIYRCLQLYRPGALQVLSDTPDEGRGVVGKQSAGVLGTLRAYTQVFDTLSEVWPDTKNGFSLSEWIKSIDKKESDRVFSNQIRMIILPYREEFSKLTGFFVSVVLNHLFREIMSLKDSKERKIHCMIDEAGVFPRIPSLAPVSKTGRSKGLRLYFGLQEVGVINSIFKQDGGKETILNSFSIKLVGRAETPEFANYFSSTFGKNTYKKMNKSSGKDSKGNIHTNRTAERVVEDAITSGELLEIPAASLENGAIFYVRIPGCSIVRLRLPINPTKKKYPNIVESKILTESKKVVQGASIYDSTNPVKSISDPSESEEIF
jgi:type IV secretory pathway TraG/TraD family ATPase VirD4